MTLRRSGDLQLAGILIAMLVMLGGLYAYGASREAKIEVLKSRVDGLEVQLHRMENKIDFVVERVKK